ncbi:MAG: amidohydrolase, partial [bacterium]
IFILMIGIVKMTPAQNFATKVFINGKIWTGASQQSEVSALVVQGERIVAVGDKNAVQRFLAKENQTVDLKGKRVLPGFNDAHVHFMSGGFYLLGIDLRKARDAQEFRTIMQDYAAKLPTGRWITGGDWDHEAWPDKKWPTKDLIDDVTPEHPVMVNRLDGHIALANSVALRLAKIDKETPDPFGGTIDRDPKTGEPTGILIDKAASLVYRMIPEPTFDELLAAARKAQEHALSSGVTSIQDIMASADELRAYQKLLANGELKVRLYVFRPIVYRKQLGEIGVQHGFGNPWLRIGGVKVMADGSMGAGSALFYEPYSDEATTRGLALHTKAELVQMVVEADSLGLQIALHAIGDKANAWALDAFEKAIKHNGKRDSRHRIEHAQVVLPDDLPRFAELGVIASIEPSHCIDDMRWAEKRIGERIKYSYLFRSFVKHHARLAFGTDWTVEPLNPMLGLYAAITREFPQGGPKGGWFPDEKITLEQAVEFYTSGSAYSEFTDQEKGTLVPGKLADFVVLDRDIFNIPPKEILKTKVDMTVVGGEILYER